MKAKFESIKINFVMFRGAETRNKCQSLPISKDHLAGLSDENSEESKAITEITKLVTFLCGYDDFKIRNIEGTILGGENE